MPRSIDDHPLRDTPRSCNRTPSLMTATSPGNCPAENGLRIFSGRFWIVLQRPLDHLAIRIGTWFAQCSRTEETSMNTAAPRITIVVERLKGIFLEVPGTKLSVEDAVRLSGVDEATCRAVLKALADVRFLKCQPNDVFTRASD